MRQFTVRAGERACLLRSRTGSIPRTYRILTERLDGGTPVSGVIEVHGSRWLFRRPPIELPLDTEVLVDKGFWDTLFSIFVVADHDSRVTLR